LERGYAARKIGAGAGRRGLTERVSAQVRSGGEKDYIFLTNFAKHEQALERGETGRVALVPYKAWILSEEDRACVCALCPAKRYRGSSALQHIEISALSA
jgi:hypothetical protein